MRKRYLPLLVIPCLLAVQAAHALPSSLIPEEGSIGECNFVTGELGFQCVPIFIAYVVEWMFAAIGTWAVIMMVYAGYEIALGGALGGTSDKGKQRLTWAIVGLIASLLSFAILNFVIASFTAGG
jgi:hypothetical protein